MSDPLADLLEATMPNVGTYHTHLDWLNAAKALRARGVTLGDPADQPDVDDRARLADAVRDLEPWHNNSTPTPAVSRAAVLALLEGEE